MTVYFISDLHLGHKKIHLFNEGKYRFRADTPEKHDEIASGEYWRIKGV